MNLTRRWQRILATREPDLVVLATVHPHGADPMALPHLAMAPGAVRLATVPAAIACDGETLPFAPWLVEWPTFAEVYAPQDRRIEIQETTVKIMGGAGLADVLLQAGGGQRATCRIDLWSPGLPLEDALPMVAGPVRGVPRLSSRAEGVEIAVTDGDPDRVVEYPPGPITRAEFPDAPDHVAGRAQRQVILGRYGVQVPCHQVDADGLVYYVHEGQAATGPVQAFNFGALVSQPFRVETRRSAASGAPYTALVFAAKPTTPDGLVPALSCSGGTATVEGHPIETLLARVGGYRLTPRAAQLLRESPFAQDVLLNRRGDVRRIVAEQIIPQTDLVIAFRHGMIDMLSLSAIGSETRLGIGTGLLYRHARQDGESAASEVINAFELRCGRSGNGGGLVTIRRDVGHGSAAIRDVLAQSQSTWGRHAAEWDASDLAAYRDSGGALFCPAGELLGDVLARQHAAPWRPHGYRASWLEGMALELGQRVLLTDPAESLDDAACVVSSREVTPTGVDVIFSRQSDPARKTTQVREIFGV